MGVPGPVLVTVPNLQVASQTNKEISFVFANNNRNVQLLLPLRINLTCTGATACAAYPELPAFIASNMVLQRAPARAAIWGHNAKAGETVTVQLDETRLDKTRQDEILASPSSTGAGTNTWTVKANGSGGWLVRLDPQQASAKNHTITISFSLTVRRRVLVNVAFGDVYLCSGQSNMEFSTNHAFNASAEIKDAARYPGLRMFSAAHAVANTPQTDVPDKTGGAGVYAASPWAVSSPGAFAPVGEKDFSYFSAVCYFFGRDVYTQLGASVPIGLVASAWGGQAIQVFSSPDALNDTTCGGTNITSTIPFNARASAAASNNVSGSNALRAEVEAEAEAESGIPTASAGGARLQGNGDGVTESQLWFAMLAPFLHMRFAGAVWYQGEDNCWAAHQYACLFPAMISDWRLKFTNPAMSFFFVQVNYHSML